MSERSWRLRQCGIVLSVFVAAVASKVAAAQDALMTLGKVQGGSFILTREDLLALPQCELTERPPNMSSARRFRGPLLADVIEASDHHHIAGIRKGDAIVMTTDGGSFVITAQEITKYEPILALEIDGATLSKDDLGPFLVMWPFSERPEIDNESFHSRVIPRVDGIEVQ